MMENNSSSPLSRLLRRRFDIIVYCMTLGCEALLLWQCRAAGLLAEPGGGTDQLSMVKAAGALADGVLPGAEYRYSYAYTLFLSLLSLLSGHRLVVMRLLQAAICALIPVVIYRAARLMRLGFEAAALGALCWIFYAPAMLISLDFLRAAPLTLTFILAFYQLLRLEIGKRRRNAVTAGLLLAVLILGRENFALPVVVVLVAAALPPLRRRIGGARNYGWLFVGTAVPVAAVMMLNLLRFGSFQPVPGNAENILDFYHGAAATEPLALAWSLLARIPSQLAAWCSNYEMPNSLSVYAHREVVELLKVFCLPFNLILALAMAGIWFNRRKTGMPELAVLAGLYILSMLFFTLFYRFRIPVIPLLALAAGAGIMGIVSTFRSGRRRTALAALLLALFVLLSYERPDARRTESERAAVARHLIDLGRFEAADRYFRRMHRDGFDVTPGVILLLKRRLEAGDTEGFEKSITDWKNELNNWSSP